MNKRVCSPGVALPGSNSRWASARARRRPPAEKPAVRGRLVERFLMDGYEPRQDSTYALTLYRHDAEIDGKKATAAPAWRAPCPVRPLGWRVFAGAGAAGS